MNSIRNYTLLAFTLLATQASAQEASTNMQLDKDLALIAPVKKGLVVPFSGVLLTPAAAAKLVADYEVFEDRVRLEVDKAVSISQARLTFEMKEQEARCNSIKTVQIAQIDSKDKQIAFLENEIKDKDKEISSLKEDTPNRTVWFGMGFASAMIFTIATAYAIGQVAN
jgi:hypothetical protein